MDCWLVPDDTVNKGTSKRQKNGWKNHLFGGARFSINIWLKKFIPLHPAPIRLRLGLIRKNTNVDRETCTALLSVFFGLVLTPQKYLYLVRALIFLLHLGTHLNKTGDELLYYHLYHEETPLYMDVHHKLFNRPFIIFFSLSSQ